MSALRVELHYIARMKRRPLAAKRLISIVGRPGRSGKVFTDMTVPGLGVVRILNREVYERALARADAAIRETGRPKKA